jgi:Putative zinc-finger
VMLKKGFDRFVKLGCSWRYGSLLSAYLDNELDAHAEGLVARHLRECARCRVEFEQLRFASKAMVEFEVPPTRGTQPAGQVFQLPVAREVSPARRLYSRRIEVPLPLAAGVVIALIGVGLFAIGRNQRTPIQSYATVPPPASEVIKVVEVPVERVVTRRVYSSRSDSRRIRTNGKQNDFTLTAPNSKGDIAQNPRRTAEWSDSALRDFRPAVSANLRVVKGNEK